MTKQPEHNNFERNVYWLCFIAVIIVGIAL